jgi:hypothetical protein
MNIIDSNSSLIINKSAMQMLKCGHIYTLENKKSRLQDYQIYTLSRNRYQLRI